MTLAICPGSFDPITIGHLDIITRASKIIDRVIVVVSFNAAKDKYAFAIDERIMLVQKAIEHLPNVVVDSCDELLADYAKARGADAIVKGLRAMSDFEYEFQMALFNKKVNPDAETIFLTAAPENMYLSSSLVKQVASFGGDISEFVPSCILSEVEKRLKQ